MPTPDLSPAFRAALEPLLSELAWALARGPFALALDAAATRVRVSGDRVLVPVRYEAHWRRFGTVPTDLVREAAYEAVRRTPGRGDEADWQVFAEAFLRDHVLSHD